MKRIIAFYVTILLFCAGNVFALDKTSTGFYWPIGIENFDQADGGWLERDADNGGEYYDGKYHIGVDMMTSGNFYAIADGEVFYKDCNNKSWGPGNCALFIRHKKSNGAVFTGLYGHLRTTLDTNSVVSAGQPLGYAGPWDGGKHLHFGIRYSDSITPSPWGRLLNSDWPNTNGFIDPVTFIKTYSPKCSRGIPYKRVLDQNISIYWTPANVSCTNAAAWCYGTCSTNFTNGVCSTAHNALLNVNWSKYAQQEWQYTFFGNQAEFDSVQQCGVN